MRLSLIRVMQTIMIARAYFQIKYIFNFFIYLILKSLLPTIKPFHLVGGNV